MKKKIFIAAAVMISSCVQAQNEQALADSAKRLTAVIVTANKIEQKQNETGKVLTIISRDELEKSAGKTIGEVLNQQVGMSIGGANSTLGTVQTIYTRGAAAANTLILIDGIPLYDPSGISSEFDLNTFVTDQVERIEILKGAQSTLYGSDAVAGVINIISRKATVKKYELALNLSAGSYNTFRGSANLSGTLKNKVQYLAGYSRVYSDGFSSAYDSTGKSNFDDDVYKQEALLASLSFDAIKGMRIKLYGKYNINKAQIDAGAFTDDKDYRYQTTDLVAGANIRYQLKKTQLYLNYSRNDYERKYNNDSADIGGFSNDPFAFYNKYIRERYKGSSDFTELYGRFSLHKNIELVGGVDLRFNNTSQDYLYISNYGPYEPVPIGKDTAKTRQFSTYASLLFNNRHGFTAGIGGRFNDHSVYGSNGTYSFNPAYSYKKIKLFVNIASAYRAPSLYQVFSEFGNRELTPEQSVSTEAGLQYSDKKFTGRVVVFHRKIKDVFIFYTDPITFSSIYKNEDEQQDHGIELESSLIITKALMLNLNYAYVNGKIATKDMNGKDTSFSNLYRRPKNLFNADLSYKISEKAFVRAHCRSVGSFYEPKFGMAPVRLSGYYTLDLYGEYQLQRKIKAFLDLKNITDQKYFDQEGFNTRRFNVNGGISIIL